MNTIKKVLSTVLIIYSSFCYSQQVILSDEQELAYHKRIIARVPYIFEGKVIKQEYFHGANDRWGILTCSIVQITKIYKGGAGIQLGTIKVITAQGGPNSAGFMTIQEDGGSGLTQGGTYIIFGTPADSSRLHEMPSDNSVTLTMDEPICFRAQNPITWGQTQYKKINDLYAFFKENGLQVEQQMSPIPSDSTKH
jgi:hypothetical protein